MTFKFKEFICGVLVGSVLISGFSYATTHVKLVVDGKEVQSDVPPQVIDGRTLVPARFLAEALGAKVEWDESQKTVIVVSQEQQKYNIPGNLNPAFILFKYILIDPSVAEQQFVDPDTGKEFIEELRRAAAEVQIKDLHEVGKRNGQVEYSATFLVKRNSGYDGTIAEGENHLFFLVEKQNEMDFKIVSLGTGPHILP